MHGYNALLPPAVKEGVESSEETALGEIVQNLQQAWNPEEPSTKFATLKWTSLIRSLVKSKATLPVPQLEELVKLGLDVFLRSPDNLYVQIRWASCLNTVLDKSQKKELNLKLEWRPFYQLMVDVHFKRRKFYEGVALQQIHLEMLVVLVCNCRRYFAPGSASEIWSEFRPYLEDVVHSYTLEAVGFLSLFMPTQYRGPDMLTSEWVEECLRLWDVIPDCPYWNRQWASLLGRFIKNRTFVSGIQWKPYLPKLFHHYLSMFEVPVAKSESTPPVEKDVPYDLKLAFDNTKQNGPRDVAKGIVYLLRPDGHAQARFEQLVDLLEQYYHPSNGGSWTSSLEHLLRHLTTFFVKRLSYEQANFSASNDSFLTPADREAFAQSLLKLIERGQYSKNSRLASTASYAASTLTFVAPSIVIPFVASQFEAALVTETATHQLKSALKTLALSSRAILLAAAKEQSVDVPMDDREHERYSFYDCKTILADALFTTLLGMDANDPPKSLATLQFYTSVISSIGVIGDVSDGGSDVLPVDWSQWLDEFLSRLFALLTHLESSAPSHSGDLHREEVGETTFLRQEDSLYYQLLELLFGRLTAPLLQLALKKVASFVLTNSLSGAPLETGLLCCALVHVNPVDAVEHLLVPLMMNVLTTLADAQPSGSKVHLPPAAEVAVASRLMLLADGTCDAGFALLQFSDIVKDVLAAAFRTSSVKVNESAERFLSGILHGLAHYYPIRQYRSTPGEDGLEVWIGTKSHPHFNGEWHMPSQEEIQFAEALLKLHLLDALEELEKLCESKETFDKDMLRVLLLRIQGCLRGAGSCLPDFSSAGGKPKPTIFGKTGACVGNSQLRERTADTLLKASECFLEVKADDTASLLLLVDALNFVVNYGYGEYSEWSDWKQPRRMDSKNLCEPKVNFITGVHPFGRQRPAWLIMELAQLHNLWRASQAGYRVYDYSNVSPYVRKVAMELLKHSLHNYADVRRNAASALTKVFKRYPPLVKDCMPLLASSLQDSTSVEHTALGACGILSSRPVLRHVTQDWTSLVMFITAVLGSSHHGSPKAQVAIIELAMSFSVRYSAGSIRKESYSASDYTELIRGIEEPLTKTSSVHWRYAVMAHIALICLVPPPDSAETEQVLETRKHLAGKFCSGVANDFPPLRSICLVGLLLLFRAKDPNLSIREPLTSTFEDPSFAATVVKKLSLDSEGQAGQASKGDEMNVLRTLPSFVRTWPSTRNSGANLKGQSFSSSFANFFKLLVEECGDVVLRALRGHLEEAANAVEEKGMQCVAAEVAAGFLHSDAACVAEAWDDWFGTLFRRSIMQANLDVMPEWATCIRFAVSSKGRKGLTVPPMRHKILKALMEPVPESSSSSLVSKRLKYLIAALLELRPSVNMDTGELSLQLDLLLELKDSLAHHSAQVRSCVATVLCLVCTNLSDLIGTTIKGKAVPEWRKMLIEGITSASAKIQSAQTSSTSDNNDVMASEDTKEAVKFMETALQFLISTMALGRASKAMSLLVAVLPSVLSLQETAHKDLSNFARLAVYVYQWQTFHDEYGFQAVSCIVSAAKDSVWRTRAAALRFIQSFVFRHAFSLEATSIRLLWDCVQQSLSDAQPEVRELASTTLAGMMRGLDDEMAATYRQGVLDAAQKQKKSRQRRGDASSVNGIVMGLRACILCSPYDIPRWLPEILVAFTKFASEPPPTSKMVSKTFDEFKRTHADAWAYQKNKFSEEQLEALSDLSSSASYFA